MIAASCNRWTRSCSSSSQTELTRLSRNISPLSVLRRISMLKITYRRRDSFEQDGCELDLQKTRWSAVIDDGSSVCGCTRGFS
uniref:Uncharacterized protein n=1 Tax=Hyaloperonospora arabidopsidis (strain Emoy2) TaxID=559515 RepID=M4BPM7_HYAAE